MTFVIQKRVGSPAYWQTVALRRTYPEGIAAMEKMREFNPRTEYRCIPEG